ncbi:Ig-like domain-containing protein [Marinobacter sp. JSM 1782161]|uniref:Ig-like domain-containing protein n=1 Tax=Marinobacter sp. JSM 1782161 TaxID=2685906 RepID=UPI0014020F91|nr:Ig-like domain-containing protein [Marinobacter sp. JSM 1782161]
MTNNKIKILALTPALLLAACGGEEQSTDEPKTPGSVIYSYPADGQASISTEADIVLRFSNPITDEDVAGKVRIAPSGSDAGIGYSVSEVDGGNSLVLTPDEALAPGTDYTVSFTENLDAAGNRTIATPNATGEAGIQFVTRGGLTEVAALANLSDDFTVLDSLPDGDTFHFMDFSTVRLRTSHPIHPDSAVYGTTVSLLDGEGSLVPATLLVKGNKLTVDPCTTDDPHDCGGADDQLDPAQTYTLSLNGVMDRKGNTLNYEETFQPQETGPTEVLYQEIVDSGFSQQSILNGQYVNAVTLNSVLQGTAGPSQQTGALYAELGYAPSFPGDTPVPLRVPKGTILESTSLDVKVNGSVPVLDAATGQLQQTGTIKVTMLSDAMGYLYPNPYSDSVEAPRHVRLWMDVSMNTEEAQPNASLSQDLLRVELSGVAIVEDGILTIDAIGMVEPNLLGQEFTDSTIAFRIEADTSEQDIAPERPIDQTGPQLVSWMPGPEDAIPATRQSMQRPGDPVVLNFDEPLDADSVANGVTLFEGGTEVTNLRTRLDGTVVVVNPEGGLKHGVDYSLNINSSLTDIAGNGATSETLNFALPALDDDSTTVTERSPIALTTYPGYPCVTRDLDLANNSHGYCIDKPSETDVPRPDGQPVDELPVTSMPADRPIVVVFSQSMELDSIRLNETFEVQKVDASGSSLGNVNGRLELNNQRIRFYPDQPWEEDALYRYRMKSVQDGVCSGSAPGFICGENGLALQTDILVDSEDTGGPNLDIYFRGGPALESVFTPLRNLPIRDTNSNYIVDCASPGETNCLEPFNHEAGNDGFKPSANAAKLLMNGNASILGTTSDGNARVGCDQNAAEDCPENKFIYQTYGLNTEVIGPAENPMTGENTAVRVLLYPTLLVTTPARVYLDTFGEQNTGPQILRMRYGAAADGNPMGLVEGVIYEGTDGRPTFETSARLTLDAPNLTLPLGELLSHNLFSYPFTLELDGPITFFDDGRMQIAQYNNNVPEINVAVAGSNDTTSGFLGFVSCLGGIFTGSFGACEDLGEGSGQAVKIPLKIPEQGVYLNFISNPIKEIPEEG